MGVATEARWWFLLKVSVLAILVRLGAVSFVDIGGSQADPTAVFFIPRALGCVCLFALGTFASSLYADVVQRKSDATVQSMAYVGSRRAVLAYNQELRQAAEAVNAELQATKDEQKARKLLADLQLRKKEAVEIQAGVASVDGMKSRGRTVAIATSCDAAAAALLGVVAALMSLL